MFGFIKTVILGICVLITLNVLYENTVKHVYVLEDAGIQTKKQFKTNEDCINYLGDVFSHGSQLRCVSITVLK